MTSHMGLGGLIYRTQIGLHRSSSETQVDGTAPVWDVYIGGLPFMLATNPEMTYQRETVPTRRERFDSEREPGEASLDSGLWLRSQTSWHLGAGQRYAEPLEGDPSIARFRFHDSGGVDPWTSGQLSLLPSTASVAAGVRHAVGVPALGVVAATNTGIVAYAADGTPTALTSAGDLVSDPALGLITRITASDTHWYGISAAKLHWGLLTGGGLGSVASTATAVAWVKDRLWLGESKGKLYEIPNNPPTVLPAVFHTFRSGNVVDIDSGAGGVYVMVDGPQTAIYVVTAQDSGTLNPPREVATLPKGEAGRVLYGYLGGFLVIGTDQGVRVADCSEASSLPVGPLIIEEHGGCWDAVGQGNYIYVTAGTEKVSPDGVERLPGLYRIDLAAPIRATANDTSAARFAYATDLYCDIAGDAWCVTTSGGRIWVVAGAQNDADLWRQSDTLVSGGWITSGEITYSTAERKSWLSLTADVTGAGDFYLRVTTDSAALQAVTQTMIPAPWSGSQMMDTTVTPASTWLSWRLDLTGDGTEAGSPTVQAVGLRATPAPRRTRHIRLPLLCTDIEVDRNQTPVGYEGFGYDRLLDLEALEEAGELVLVTDTRTGETRKCQIDRVAFIGSTPPDRGRGNFGGVLQVTLLTV